MFALSPSLWQLPPPLTLVNPLFCCRPLWSLDISLFMSSLCPRACPSSPPWLATRRNPLQLRPL